LFMGSINNNKREKKEEEGGEPATSDPGFIKEEAVGKPRSRITEKKQKT